MIEQFINYGNDALKEYVQSIYVNVHPVRDTELLSKIQAYSKIINIDGSIYDVLKKLSGQNGWSD
ncbi:NTPase, partial [Escherichia coli]|nr:NTPase [Escherichia coli]